MFRSRPPADHVAHVRLTADDLSKLAEFCVRSERTQSEVLRALIRGLDIAMAEAHRSTPIVSHYPSQGDPGGA
jgi:hypothetical protein